MLKFNEIKTRNQLADYLKIPRALLTYILYEKGTENYYTSFEVPKRSGGVRAIHAPTDELKDVQKRLADALTTYYMECIHNKGYNANISHAFTKKKNIITNAEIHRNKKYILNIDLKDFFDSFHFGRVKGYFEKNRDYLLTKEVATIVAQLSCYKGCLPQGAPTSPIITNLICSILDNRLLKIAKMYRLNYTRYADDLTFSTNDKQFQDNWKNFLDDARSVIERSGFKVNEEKTRFVYNDSRQVVTGLTVNEKISVSKEFYKNTRAMADHLYRNGTYFINGEEGTLNQLEGRFSFIDNIDKYNNERDKNGKHHYKCLNSREKQYQKFLFYKYFFNNSVPTIVTEGKTDILYLLAAIRANYGRWLDSEGDSIQHITFLRRSKRLKYFFNLQENGADTMKNIYGMYTGSDSLPNYFDYFTKISGTCSGKPIIFIFDNEMATKKRPLYKFLKNEVKIDDEKKEILSSTCKVNLKGNLYLVTNPLVDGKNECEIEDLFLRETLEHKINGKSFSREKEINLETEYNKATFAEYIFENYKTINFERFLPMLDAINDIIMNHCKE